MSAPFLLAPSVPQPASLTCSLFPVTTSAPREPPPQCSPTHCCCCPSPPCPIFPRRSCLPFRGARKGSPSFLPLPACLPVFKKTGDASWVVRCCVALGKELDLSVPLVRIQIKESKGLSRGCTWQVLSRSVFCLLEGKHCVCTQGHVHTCSHFSSQLP